ncbi:Clathrin, heavy chain [Trema orientale]|uniref:Clathrin, heavy chain n=1 Tax=Trema orientale TaxID=63057 RepID=A0A2P5EZV6_TREOI|nr:Clathrin, heavy chain [Trema orientale]
MDSLKKLEKIRTSSPPANFKNNARSIPRNSLTTPCITPFCFFCTMKEPDSRQRRAKIANCFKQMPIRDDQENVLVLSGLWHIAMSHPDDSEFPSLGVFECMASLIQKALNDKEWLSRDQNIYIPYYAAHVIGSYTMKKVEFAEMAVGSVIPPLMELLRGKKMTWVEQRVAVRALGHLASYERTFEALSQYEEEVVRLAMSLASTCLDVVYDNFVGVKDTKMRLKYHSDLLTRGVGGLEMENFKAEEWTSQIQCWSLYLLNCFAYKERSLNIICEEEFLKNLCGMWGGLANHVSPAGVGLIRILCYNKYGRKKIAEMKEVIEYLCNLSRSSDDWQYMGIDCLLLLLKDLETRYKVIDIALLFLVDLVELRDLGDRTNLGEEITKALLLDYSKEKKLMKFNISSKVQKAFEDLWDWKVERRRKEKLISEEKLEERRVLVGLIKQQANRLYCLGEIEEATRKYSEALALCPIRLGKERMVLYSNRAQCQLLLKDPDSAIRDSTRALCLSTPANSHGKSLWRRSQAYDMKGLAKESLMDCIMFINGCIKSDPEVTKRSVKIPYYAARMISKQMEATWLFAMSRSKSHGDQDESTGNDEGPYYKEMMRNMMDKRGLSTIREEPFNGKEEINGRKLERPRRSSKRAVIKRPTSQIGLPYVTIKNDHGIHYGGSKSCEGYSKFSPLDVISF